MTPQVAERVPVVVEVPGVAVCEVALRASVVLVRLGIKWFVAAKLCLWFDQYYTKHVQHTYLACQQT